MSVRIYVEGGGDTSALKSECRRGFREFFAKFIPPSKQPKVIACGSRREAFNDFCTALLFANTPASTWFSWWIQKPPWIPTRRFGST